MPSIYKRENKKGEPSFLLKAFLYVDADGKNVTKSKTWKPPKGMKPETAEKQATKEAILFEEELRKGNITIDGGMKFAEYAEKWLETKEYKPNVMYEIKQILETVNQAIGHIPLDKLKPEHLQSFYKNLREEGSTKRASLYSSPTLKDVLEEHGIKIKRLADIASLRPGTVRKANQDKWVEGKTAKKIVGALEAMGVNAAGLFSRNENPPSLAPGTINKYHRTIAAILNAAKRSRVLPHSIVEFMDAPKKGEKEARYLDDVQAREYLFALLKEPHMPTRTALAMLLFTGMRRGELCGLEWHDIDFLERKIHIRRTSNYAPDAGIYTSTPKTKGSLRSITVTPFLLDMIREYQEWQNERAASLGDQWNNELNRLFTGGSGKPINPTGISRAWAKRFHERAGIPYINLHALRHTFITLQIAAGVDIRTLQARSGHANASTLLNVYSHAIQSAQDKAAAALENVLLADADTATTGLIIK